MSFDDDKVVPPGHTMTFKDAIHTVSSDITLGIVLPDWVKLLTSRMRRFSDAVRNLQVRQPHSKFNC